MESRGEESSNQHQELSLLFEPPVAMVNFTTGFFSEDFRLRFTLDRFRLDPAGKSSRTFYRSSDEKKNVVLCFVLRSLRLPYLPVDWNQVWECLAIF